uniref:Uncharacterized protein n=1 Tax=Ascaris lumbricoides TaxID=6252 RepID=A0A0M3HZH4_ASCLU
MKTSLYSQDDYACYAAPQFTSRDGVLQDSYVSASGVVVNNKGGTTGRPSSDLYLPRKRRKPKTRKKDEDTTAQSHQYGTGIALLRFLYSFPSS